MEQQQTVVFTVDGMTCPGCEGRIEKRLSALNGVGRVQASYARGTVGITFDPGKLSTSSITQQLKALDYRVTGWREKDGARSPKATLPAAILIVLGLFLFLRHFGLQNLLGFFPQAEAGMGYGMLFVIGLLTSLHCVAMCGGISLSQCLPGAAGSENPRAALRPSLLYNAGRVLSYTAVGAAVGGLGSVISFSGAAKGVVQIAAGIFMVIMGLAMLGILPGLRRLVPRMPRFLARRVEAERSASGSPLYIGLLNGLMPCGPLQAMQLYALSTGSPLKGALSMLLFSLGTVPLMFGFGALSSLLSKRFTRQAMSVGAVLVVVLGVSMFSSGLSLSGAPVLAAPGGGNEAGIDGGVQYVNTTLGGGRYQPITVQAGVPVEWTITAEPGTITGCNNRMLIPAFGIEHTFSAGDNVITFTPQEEGTFAYSCWMGMIRSTITVVGEDGAVPDQAEPVVDQVPYLNGVGGSCC